MVKFDPNTRHLILMYVTPRGYTKIHRTIDLSGIDEDTVQFVIQIAKTVVNFANFNLDISKLKQQGSGSGTVNQPVVLSTVERLHQKLVARRNMNIQPQTPANIAPTDTTMERTLNMVKRTP